MILHDIAVKCNGAVARKYSVIKVFLKIQQNSQESTCLGVSFLIKRESNIGVLCKCCEIFKNVFSYRTPSVAATTYTVSTETNDHKRIGTKQHYPLQLHLRVVYRQKM